MAVINGDDGANILTPVFSFNSEPFASDADDTIFGHGGNDTLDGGGGNDTLDGGAGADKLEGGTGVNTASYADDATGVTVDLTKQVTFSTDNLYTPTPASGHEQHGGDAEGDLLAHIQNIVGGSGDDTLTGDSNDNVIEGSAGADVLSGGGGIDTLSYEHDTSGVTIDLAAHTATGGAAQGDDISAGDFENVTGGIAGDTISGVGDGVANVIKGGAGADHLSGDAEDTVDYSYETSDVAVDLTSDTFSGGGSDETGEQISGFGSVTGGSGNDTLTGDSGDNVLTGNGGDDTLIGKGGHDTLDGGDGIDTADYSGAAGPVTVNLSTHTADDDGDGGSDTFVSIENVTGSTQADNITGDDGDNVIDGNGGGDTIDGAGGNDRLIAGDGGSVIHGGTGDDVLVSGNGYDQLYGDDGNDLIIAGTDDDLHGEGLGADTADYSTRSGAVSIDLSVISGGHASAHGASNDYLYQIENIVGTDFDDVLTGGDIIVSGVTDTDNVLTGGAGNDTISGKGGDDTISGGTGADTLDGGTGSDTLDYGTSLGGVTVTLLNGVTKLSGGDAAGDVATNFENVTGSSISGNVLIGDNGNNTLIGGDFIDKLTGGAGDDTLEGGAGPDSLDGGAGFDTVSYENSTSGVFMVLGANGKASDASSDGDTVTSVERLVGSSHDDSLFGNNLANTLEGGAGNDTLEGGEGNDTILGGAGNDTLHGDGGDDVIEGGAGSDTLDGGSGTNTVSFAHSTQAVTVSLALQGSPNEIDVDLDTTTVGTAGVAFTPNQLLVTTVHADGNHVTYSITGGADQSAFTIDPNSGLLSLSDHIPVSSDPDFNQNGHGSADLRTVVFDGSGGATIFDAQGNFQSSGNASDFYGFIAGTFVGWGDFIHTEDLANHTYFLGADGILYSDYAGGEFGTGFAVNVAPYDLAKPHDIGHDGHYDVIVTATDGTHTNSTEITAGPATMLGGDAQGDTLLNFKNLIGSDHDDTLTGDNQGNTIDGGAGNDTIIGGSGNSTLRGGDGNDTITGGAGNDIIEGGAGNDTLNGGSGVNTLSYASDTTGVTVNFNAHVAQGDDVGTDTITFSSFVNLTGGSGNDTLSGDDADPNVIQGGAGDDIINGLGGGGADTLDGGAGFDIVDYSTTANVTINLGTQYIDTNGVFTGGQPQLGGDAAGDKLAGFEGVIGSGFDDVIVGSSKDDYIDGGGGSDKLDGGAGNDTLSFVSFGSTGVQVNLGLAAQTSAQTNPGYIFENVGLGLYVKNFENLLGTAGDDLLIGDSKNNVIDGGSDHGGGTDTLDGMAGTDTLSFTHYTVSGVNVDLGVRNADGTVTGGITSGFEFHNFENLIGTDFSDQLTGMHNAASTIDGGAGNDTIDGGSAADHLSGGIGNDFISGGGGNDVLDGGTGNDGGGDTLDYSYLNSPAKITVTLGAFDVDTGASAATKTSGVAGDIDTISNFENVTGGLGNDKITGNDAVNVLHGNGGDDTVDGGAGNDIIDGGAGNDILSGGAGNDVISGLDGDDIIEGGAGRDILDGGENNEVNGDTVSFAHSAGPVRVDLGFVSNSGQSDSPIGAGSDADLSETVAGFENIIGSAFDDVLYGTKNSATTLVNRIDGGAGNDFIEGGAGADLLIGGAGSDTLSYYTSVAGNITVDLSHQATLNTTTGALTGGVDGVGGDAQGDKFTGFENIIGGHGDDKLTGDANANIIIGSLGEDIIDGGAGNDTLGGRSLSVGGNSSADSPFGTISGNDTIYGGAGNDLILGDDGHDKLDGGAGIDTLSYAASATFVVVNLNNQATVTNGVFSGGMVQGGTGSDADGDIIAGFENVIGSASGDYIDGDGAVNLIRGGDGLDSISGGAGNDTLMGEGGNDEFTAGGAAGAGADTMDGGDGFDHVGYNDETVGLTVTLGFDGASATVTGGAGSNAKGDKLISIEYVTGGSGDDVLTGNNIDHTLEGGDGNDRLVGGTGSSMLDGGAGDDIIVASTGAIENYEGGSNNAHGDTLSFAGFASAVTISMITDSGAAAGIGTLTIDGFERLIGSAHDDILYGDPNQDVIAGGAGNDFIHGGPGGGNTLAGEAGINTLDYFSVGAGVTVDLNTQAKFDANYNVILTGGHTLADYEQHGGDAEGDLIAGFANVNGGTGDDKLTGDGNANVLYGDAGNDTLTGNGGDDTLIGGTGLNILDGGAGNDTASYAGMTDDLLINLDSGSGENTGVTFTDTLISIENVIGGSGDDNIFGTAGVNVLNGGDGNDNISGGDGADIINGGDGGDGTAGPGLLGEGGNDTINGGDGDDTIMGGLGADKMDGGDGSDTIEYAGAAGQNITINLAKDTVTAVGAAALAEVKGDTFKNFENVVVDAGNNTLIGDAGANHLVAGAGNDTLDGGGGGDLLIGGLGNDTYVVHDGDTILDSAGFGGGGIDTVMASFSYDLSSLGVFADIENLTLTGTAAIDGTGNALDNVITGNSAANTLSGAAGNDTIIGGLGADTMDGGGDIDTVSYATDTKGVSIDLQANTVSGAVGGEAHGDSIANFENVIGGKGADHITGTDGDNVISGGAGNDVLDGGTSNANEVIGDTLDYSYLGASAKLTVTLGETGVVTTTSGVAGDVDNISNFENIIGGAGNDKLTGNSDANSITGRAGDDVIEGGAGADILDGSIGNNTVSYEHDTAGVSLNLFSVAPQHGGDAEGDQLINFANAIGGSGDDTINWSSTATISGGAGNDQFGDFAGGGNISTVSGGAGNDFLLANGIVKFDGGADFDTIDFFDYSSGVTVTLGANGTTTGLVAKGAGLDDSVITNVEGVNGSTHDDILTANNLNTTLNGGTGNDILTGGAGNDTLSGNDDNDIISGGLGADTLDGGLGIDTLSYAADTKGVTVDLTDLGGGQQTVSGVAGGEANGDSITNFENVIGGSGADHITGSAGDNIIIGGLGDDTLDGGGGIDTLDYSGAAKAVTVDLYGGHVTGGAGNDTVSNFENVIGSKFNDTISGSDQVNVLTGGGGVDTLDYSGSAGGGISIDLMFNNASGGDAQGDTISGFTNINGTNAGDNALVGDNNANTIKGNGGDDLIMGRGGADTLDGGTGGETNGDTVQYAESFQSVTVTLGVYNAMTGTSGLATVSGGDATGDKVTNFENLNGSNNVGDVLTGNAGVNRIKGLQGDDVVAGGGGADLLDGGAGNDTVSYAASAQAVTVSLANQGNSADGNGDADFNDSMHAGAPQIGGDADGDLLWNFENVIGSKNADTLTGDASDNVIIGGLGDDMLDGGAGNDTLDYSGATKAVTVDLYGGHVTGGAGTDTVSHFENVIGTKFNDIISGSADANVLDGGAGVDTLDYSGSASGSGVTIDLTANTASGGDAAGDTISGFENINGTSHNDALTGTAGANVIHGNDGNDNIEGRGGADTMDGGLGSDDVLSYFSSTTAVTVTLGVYNAITGATALGTASGGDAAGDKFTNFENLTGGHGNDILTGNAGGNVLSGGEGNDILTGGAQVDTLTGGDGADVFNYRSKAELAGASDFITDFISADGDKIGISKSGFGIAAGINATTFASQNYFIDEAGHTATNVGHAEFIFDNTSGRLYFDADGQAGGEVDMAHFSGVAHMSASDFLLK